jgi:hypothetical protein
MKVPEELLSWREISTCPREIRWPNTNPNLDHPVPVKIKRIYFLKRTTPSKTDPNLDHPVRRIEPFKRTTLPIEVSLDELNKLLPLNRSGRKSLDEPTQILPPLPPFPSPVDLSYLISQLSTISNRSLQNVPSAEQSTGLRRGRLIHPCGIQSFQCAVVGGK